MTEIDKFDENEANKLLQNINTLGDLTKLMVPNPESKDMKTISLPKWVTWLIKHVETYGEFGVEPIFLEIIKIMDNNMNIMRDRVKEQYRRLINVIRRQEIEINKVKEREKGKEQIQEVVTNEITYEHSYEVGEKGNNVIKNKKEEGKDDIQKKESEKPKKRGGLVIPPEYLNREEKKNE